jgi:hypothetical protein
MMHASATSDIGIEHDELGEFGRNASQFFAEGFAESPEEPIRAGALFSDIEELLDFASITAKRD